MPVPATVPEFLDLVRKGGLVSEKKLDDLLGRYERQRRHVAISHSQADTIRNKRLLAEKDPAVRQKNHEQLRRTSEDPKLARAFLLRSSLIDSIREADRIP